MRLIRTAAQIEALCARLQRQGRRIGVIPTMGALHEGHGSLIRAAVLANDVVIVTLFVNPLQFGPREDFHRYPRTLARDLRLAQRAGAHVCFAPDVQQIYPEGFQTTIEIGRFAARWEGAHRPGHFHGVATVVAILFQLTRPANAYLGQKDYQQALIIRQLVRDLHMPVHVHVLPTVREADGVALSSRNRYLSPEERRRATVLIRALRAARARARSGERRSRALVAAMRRELARAQGVHVDYAAVADARTLEPVARMRGRVVLLVAVRIGATRLIDNLLVDVS